MGKKSKLRKKKQQVGFNELDKKETRVSNSKANIAPKESPAPKEEVKEKTPRIKVAIHSTEPTVDEIMNSTSSMLVTTVELPKKLLDDTKHTLSIKSNNEAVQLAMAGYLTLSDKQKQTITDEATALRHRYSSYDDRHTMTKVTLRISNCLYHRISSNSTEKFSKVIRIALVSFLEYYKADATLKRPMTLAGTKWGKPMINAIDRVLEGRHYTTHFEPCMGALGIFANHDVADNAILCDTDTERVNLFTQIRDNITPFLLQFACLTHTNKEYGEVQEILSELHTPLSKAIVYFYTNLHADSFGNDGKYHERTFSFANFNNLYCLSKRLQGVTIRTCHILKSIPKYSKPDTVIICDPPYIATNSYGKSNTLTNQEHHQIARMLIKSKCDFVYHCRTTAKGKNKEADKNFINASLDDFFCDQGLFFTDIEIKGNECVTIERIITNFEFDGCTSYTREVAYHE